MLRRSFHTFVTTALLGAAMLLSACAANRAPGARQVVDESRLPAIVDWLKADVAKGRIPGAVVLVARDGKILLHEAVGWADKDKGIAMTRESLHPIASSTKLVTTIAALRLVEANKLQMMTPIAAWLPELKDLQVAVESRNAAGAMTTELVSPARAPTVHDLMTHRAGFTYFFHPRNALRDRYREQGIDFIHGDDASQMLARLAKLPLAFHPGTSFEYSIATDLLGHIIERVTGKPLDEALGELVLRPLGMRDTRFHVDAASLPRLARPFSNDPDLWVFEWLDLTRPPKRFSGGAGLASTTSDYLRVLQLMLDEGELDGVRLLSPQTVRWAMANHTGSARGASHPGDGYGWSLFNPVRVAEGGPPFPGNVGDLFWGGITGPRYFVDPELGLIGMVFMQRPSVRAAYQSEFRAMVYGAMRSGTAAGR